MDSEQLETLLRNTPVNRVEKAEVMYARYKKQYNNSQISGNYQDGN